MTTPTHFFIKLAPWHGIHVWWVQHPGQGGPYSLTPGATTWPLAGEDAPKHPILCVGKCCGPALGDPRCLCINSIACLHSLVDMSMQWPILRNRSVPTILFTPGSPWWAPLGLFLVWCTVVEGLGGSSAPLSSYPVACLAMAFDYNTFHCLNQID